jgi:hypothetical protein
MNRQFDLTTQEKIMNIAKLGIVSAAMNHPAKATKPNNGGLYRVIIYTLCATQPNPTWHSWRHSFVFYIPQISRTSHSRDHSLDGQSGFVCNTRTNSPTWESNKSFRSLSRPIATGLASHFARSLNYSTFEENHSDYAGKRNSFNELNGDFERICGGLPERPQGYEDAPPERRKTRATIASGGRHE